MKARINSKELESDLIQIPTMNYGQMQRWEDFVPLNYELEFEISAFIEKTEEFYSTFRQEEIDDNDTNGFPELEIYKQVGRPSLIELISEYPDVFEGVTKFNDHDVINLLVKTPVLVPDYYYSINSLDSVKVIDGVIKLSGICFKSDYVEHTFNHEQSRKHALLKSKN